MRIGLRLANSTRLALLVLTAGSGGCLGKSGVSASPKPAPEWVPAADICEVPINFPGVFEADEANTDGRAFETKLAALLDVVEVARACHGDLATAPIDPTERRQARSSYLTLLETYKELFESWWLADYGGMSRARLRGQDRLESAATDAATWYATASWAWYYLWVLDELLRMQGFDPKQHDLEQMREALAIDEFPALFIYTDAAFGATLLQVREGWTHPEQLPSLSGIDPSEKLAEALMEEAKYVRTRRPIDELGPRTQQHIDGLYRLAMSTEWSPELSRERLGRPLASWLAAIDLRKIDTVSFPVPILESNTGEVRYHSTGPVDLAMVRADLARFDDHNLVALLRVREAQEKWRLTLSDAFGESQRDGYLDYLRDATTKALAMIEAPRVRLGESALFLLSSDLVLDHGLALDPDAPNQDEITRKETSHALASYTACVLNSDMFTDLELRDCAAKGLRDACLGERAISFPPQWIPHQIGPAYSKAITARMTEAELNPELMCDFNVMLNPDFLTVIELDSESLLGLTRLFATRVPHGDEEYLVGVMDAFAARAEYNYNAQCHAVIGDKGIGCSFAGVFAPGTTPEQVAETARQNPNIEALCNSALDYRDIFLMFESGQPSVELRLLPHTEAGARRGHDSQRARFRLEAEACAPLWQGSVAAEVADHDLESE